MLTIWAIAATPLPLSEISVPLVPFKLSSAVGSYRVPSFSFSLITSMLLSHPSGRRVSTTKRLGFLSILSPSFTFARTNAISLSVAEVNHL